MIFMKSFQSLPRLSRLWFVVVLIVLIVTNASTFFIVRSTTEVGVAEDSLKYPLIDPARNFIDQEHFIVDVTALRSALQERVADEPTDSVSLYFEFLNTGANIQINQNLPVFPASLLKVPIGMAAMKRIQDGVWDWESEFVVADIDKEEGTGYGELWKSPIGTRFTAEELLYAMLAKSDNTASNMLWRNLPYEEIQAVLLETGLEDLFSAEGEISAKEYTRFFRSLYTSSFLRREFSQHMLDILDQSDFNDFLSAPIPADIPFPHKFGIREDEVFAYLDSGIVYAPNRPYMVTVAVKGQGGDGERERVEALMSDISSIIFEYVSTR